MYVVSSVGAECWFLVHMMVHMLVHDASIGTRCSVFIYVCMLHSACIH